MIWIILFAIIMVSAGCSTQPVDCIATAEVNGVSLVYQMKGPSDGEPVVLLHGNGGRHEDLATITQRLSEAGYLVFAPDSRGQGRNAPLSEYHYCDMADDMYHFVCEVVVPHYGKEGIRPAVFGWSDGGIIALLTEIRHPGTWSRLAASGANIHPDCGAWDLEEARRHPADTSALYRMMLYEPDISVEELATISCPCLIAAGENDLIREDHTRLISTHIPGAKMLIVAGADHGSHIVGSTEMADILYDWLAGK